MNLLSANDFKTLREAVLLREEKCLIRTLRDISVRAMTFQVGPPWPVDMVIQIQMEKGNISWIQNFTTVEAAKKQIDRWEERFRWIS